MDKKINIINSNYFNQLAITGNINLLMQQQLLIVSFLNEILESSWVQFMTEEEINTLKYKLFYMLNNFNIDDYSAHKTDYKYYILKMTNINKYQK